MPNMVVLVSNMVPPEQSPDGLLHAEFVCWTEDGKQAQGSIPVDFGVVPAATHAALVSAAKLVQTAVNGVVFLPANKTMIFAGQVLN